MQMIQLISLVVLLNFVTADDDETKDSKTSTKTLHRRIRDLSGLVNSFLDGSGSAGSVGSLAGSALQSAGSVFKVAAIGYVAYLILQFFFPGLVQSFISQFSKGYETVSRNVNVDDVVQRLGNLNLSDTAMNALNALNIQGTDCRQKASCEVGQYVTANYPSLAQVLFVFGNYIPVDPGYSGSLLQGASSNSDCNSLYPTCSYSPMQRVISQSNNFV